MKISYISAQVSGEGTSVTVSLDVGAMPAMDAQQVVVEALGSIDEFTIPPSLRREAEPETEAAPAEEAPKRRRGRPKKEEATPEAPAEEEAPKRRRGRPKKEEAAPAEEAPAEDEGDEEITDIQLAKAASTAAKATDAGTVTACLDEFGVTKVNELEQEDRQTFLDTLEIMVANAE